MDVDPIRIIDKLTQKLSNVQRDLVMTEAALDQALEQIAELEARQNNPKPQPQRRTRKPAADVPDEA